MVRVKATKTKLRSASFERLHQIFGHIGRRRLLAAAREHGIKVTAAPHHDECHTCRMTKSTALPRPPPSTTRLRKLDVVAIDHSTISVPGRGDEVAYMTTEYLATRRLFVEPLTSRTSSTQPARLGAIFAAHGKPKYIRADGEFNSDCLLRFCEEQGVQIQRTAPNKGHQNGHVEQAQHQIGLTALAMLFHAGAPTELWPWAIRHACFLWNCTPHGQSKRSPFRLHDGKAVDPSLLHGVWGQRVYVHVPRSQRGPAKISPHSKYMTLVGVREGSKAYEVMDHDGRILLRTDVYFPKDQIFSGFTGQPMGPSQPSGTAGHQNFFDTSTPSPAPTTGHSPPTAASQGNAPQPEEVESDREESDEEESDKKKNDEEESDEEESDKEESGEEKSDEGRRDHSSDDEEFQTVLRPSRADDEVLFNYEYTNSHSDSDSQLTETETDSGSASSGTSGSEQDSDSGEEEAPTNVSPFEPFHTRLDLQRGAGGRKGRRASHHCTDFSATRPSPASLGEASQEEEEEAVLAARLAQTAAQERRDSRDKAFAKRQAKVMARAAKTANQVPTTRQAAGRAEMQQLRKRGTYSIEVLPRGAHVIPGHMIYTDKHDADGNFLRAKARFVADGGKQLPGTYGNPTAHTLDYTTVRLLLALAAKMRIPVHGGDVSGAYLYSAVPHKRKIYVRINEKNVHLLPEEDQALHRRLKEENPARPVVLRMHKYIYGLMDAGAEWSKEFRGTLTDLGLVKHKACRCVYSMPGRSPDQMAAVAFYVDDFLVICKDPVERKRIVDAISFKYELKHVGPATEFLGMKIVQEDDFSIRLSCPAKTRDIVSTYLPNDSTPALIPMPTGLKSSKAYCTEPDSSEADEVFASGYRTIVGKIGHLATTLRFNVVYAHRFLCEGMHAPGKTHQKVLLHLLRYLKGTSDFALTFPAGDGNLNNNRRSNDLLGASGDPVPADIRSTLAAACDATLSDCILTGLSTSGYIVWYHSAPVAWYSRRQKNVASSTAHSEYMAAAPLVATLQHLRQVLDEFLLAPTEPVPALMDNQTAIAWTQGDGKEFSLRHVRTAYHSVREAVARNEVKFQYIKSAHMPADMFTKALDRQAFERCLQLSLTGSSVGHQ